jgi:hypothetical protein
MSELKTAKDLQEAYAALRKGRSRFVRMGEPFRDKDVIALIERLDRAETLAAELQAENRLFWTVFTDEFSPVQLNALRRIVLSQRAALAAAPEQEPRNG